MKKEKHFFYKTPDTMVQQLEIHCAIAQRKWKFIIYKFMVGRKND